MVTARKNVNLSTVPSVECLVDDVSDAELSLGFEIEILTGRDLRRNGVKVG